jgi:hypothetical protein
MTYPDGGMGEVSWKQNEICNTFFEIEMITFSCEAAVPEWGKRRATKRKRRECARCECCFCVQSHWCC